jgi:hypothetical protein
MQGVSTAGNFVWHGTASAADREHSKDRSVEDSLSQFSALTTDEERERKAELRNPRTYYVVANLDSFVALREYGEGNVPVSGSAEAGSLASSAAADGDDTSSSMSADPGGSADDPNVVILTVFQELGRRPLVHRPTTTPVSPASSHGSGATVSRLVIPQTAYNGDSSGISMLDVERKEVQTLYCAITKPRYLLTYCRLKCWKRRRTCSRSKVEAILR